MDSFKGTTRLTRLALRRDRITLPLNILLVVMIMAGSVAALADAYPDYQSQLTYVSSSVISTVGRVFQGTINGVSLGSILMAETYIFTAIIMSVVSIFTVTRHSRHNEETGAAELIESSVVGKHALLTSALFAAAIYSVLSSVLIFLFTATNEDLGVQGSFYFAASLALVSLFFAGVAAITAQLSDYRRGANGYAVLALGAFFVIRAVGDALGDLSADGLSVTASWLSGLSPFGWGYQVLPFTKNNIVPLLLLVGGVIAATGLGYYLSTKRDVGSSLFQTKPGPERAPKYLSSAAGLAYRLQRSGFYIWVISMSLLGLMVTVIVNDFSDIFEESDFFADLLAESGATGNVTMTVFAAMFTVTASIATGFLVGGVSKMQDEESSGRLEEILSTNTNKADWMNSHVGLLALGAFLIVAMFGLASGISYHIVSIGNAVLFIDLLYAGVLQFPAMLVFLGVVVLAFSVLGRHTRPLAWAYFAYCMLIGSLANIFSWPDWVSYASPFYHLPDVPSEVVDTTPAIFLMAIGVGLLLISRIVFWRRDISTK